MLGDTPPEYHHNTTEGDASISFLAGFPNNGVRWPMVRQSLDYNNIQDVYLLSGAQTPLRDTPMFHQGTPGGTPNLGRKPSEEGPHQGGNQPSGNGVPNYPQIFDTPYLNQLYAEYVPGQAGASASANNSMAHNLNTHPHNEEELPSLSDISLLNFRSDTPLGAFKTPNKGSRAQIIGASTLKKITGLISTPLKSGPMIGGKLSDDEKRTDEDSDMDSPNGRNSPCVKQHFHMTNSSYTNSQTSHIFTQTSFKGDVTGDSTQTTIQGKHFQLFNDFSPTVVRKVVKPLSRSTTIASQVTPVKPHTAKCKTPDSVNSTASTIILNSTTKPAPGEISHSGLDLSPTPATKRFLNVPNITSTPDKNTMPSMGSFGPPLLGTFQQKTMPAVIRPKQASARKPASKPSGGQQFQFIMTDLKKFAQGGKTKRQGAVLKDSTNTHKRRRVNK